MTSRQLTKPIFILGSHKSGSSLLRSLLDGHPAVFAIPTEAHYFQSTGHWVDYRLRYAWPKEMSREEKIASLVSLVEKKSLHRDPYADSTIAGKIDVQGFESHFIDSNPGSTSSELFQAYVEALYYSLYQTKLPDSVRVLEKSVENAEFAAMLRQMFPDCRFVHIVRNPYASLVAIRKSKTKKHYPYIRDHVLSIENSLINLFRNKSFLSNYLVIKYEDLLSETSRVMGEIAEFLGIPFLEELTKPTLMGEAWGGNSSTGKQFKKISAKPLTSWQTQIHRFEIELVNSFLEPVLEQLGYEKMCLKNPKAKYFPIKTEKAETYIKNRSLLWLKPISSKSS